MKVLACDGIHEDGLALFREAGWDVLVSPPIKDPQALKLALAIQTARNLEEFHAISRFERNANGAHDGFTLSAVLEDGVHFYRARLLAGGLEWHELQNAAWAYTEELPNL